MSLGVLVVSAALISGSEIISGHFQRGWNGQDVQSIAGVPVAMIKENVTTKDCLMNSIRKAFLNA
jgi:hypothetical protein